MGPAVTEEFVPLVPALPSDPNGRTAIAPRPTTFPIRQADPRRGVPSALAYLATAALILLTLVGGFVAFRGSMLLVGPEQRAIILPSIDLTPERVLPSDSLADDLLLQSTVDQMPPEQGRSHQIALNRVHLAPGAVESAGSQEDTGVGLDLFTVESGQVTVEADASVVLTRAVASAAAAPILVEPGTAITLDVGDQLYVPSGVTFSRRNDGSSAATLLSFSIGTVGDIWTRATLPTGVTYNSGLPNKQAPTYPVVPADASVHRLTLPPGAEVAIRDVPGLQLIYVEAGDLDLVSAEGETPGTLEQALPLHAGSGTATFGATPERAVLVNRGAEPVVILAASVVSTSAGAPTPEATWSDGWGTGDHLPGTDP